MLEQRLPNSQKKRFQRRPSTALLSQSRSPSSSSGKKKRFVQDIEPILSYERPKKKYTHQRKNNNDGEKIKGSNKSRSNTSNSREGVKLDHSPSLQQGKSKSIEELESSMTRRWGANTIEKWTADPEKWEFVYENDDNNTKDTNVSDAKGSGNKNNFSGTMQERPFGRNKDGKKKLRSKPVLNPWEKAELAKERAREREAVKEGEVTRKKMRHRDRDSMQNHDTINANVDGYEGNKFLMDTDTEKDVILNRVRKNQQLFGSSGGNISNIDHNSNSKMSNKNKSTRGRNSKAATESNENHDETDDDRYYDNNNFPIDSQNINSLLDEYSNKDSYDRTTSKELTSLSFFNPKSNLDASTASSKTLKERKISDANTQEKKKSRDTGLHIVYDEDGNPQCLTLERAQMEVDTHLQSIASFSPTSTLNQHINKEIPSWEDLGITNASLLSNLQKMSCNSPLPVQIKAIKPIINGNDTLVSTHTGSGKTLAFLVPIIQRLLSTSTHNENENMSNKEEGVQIVVIAPGRELASQIISVARQLLEFTGLEAELALGGTPIGRNIRNIRRNKPALLVGTPGRIAELILGSPGEKGGKMKIRSTRFIVLDECDALLEYSPHSEPTRAIFQELKKRHRQDLQSCLCSATATDLLASNRHNHDGPVLQENKLDGFLQDGYSHVEVDIVEDALVTSVEGEGNNGRGATKVSRTAIHGVLHLGHKRFAIDALRKVLYTEPMPEQVLVFVDNARRVDIVVDKLANMGIVAAPLHGGSGSNKNERADVNKALRDGSVGMVVATEMAARGLDAPFLTHVINLDLPTDASHYAHRAGRCGRGGRPGVVVSFTTNKREKNVPKRLTSALGIKLLTVDTHDGKLVIIDDASNNNEKSGME
eukprot:CAMPEP_0184873364 /NCGR_PEP_ID=MMETSP0580-20130426/41803_1 /TAXON_ID=1118495 /ORGANISM="Dactyliosolen fragilissimus" /LENGTH=879 /DNA_ID=CAMNT_0027376265 /DNA_START=589 /DNA_END=3228 /DNA_ORIENTATION=-